MLRVLDEPSVDSEFALKGDLTEKFFIGDDPTSFKAWRVVAKDSNETACVFFGPMSRLAALSFVKQMDDTKAERQKEIDHIMRISTDDVLSEDVLSMLEHYDLKPE
jgi:hypothetical protein